MRWWSGAAPERSATGEPRPQPDRQRLRLSRLRRGAGEQHPQPLLCRATRLAIADACAPSTPFSRLRRSAPSSSSGADPATRTRGLDAPHAGQSDGSDDRDIERIAVKSPHWVQR